MHSLRSLTQSSQITCPVALPASSVACLEGILERELRSVEASAQRLGASLGVARGSLDAESLRLACHFQQLLQPPLRHHCEYHASIVNSRKAQWPTSGKVVIPVSALRSVGPAALALPGLSREEPPPASAAAMGSAPAASSGGAAPAGGLLAQGTLKLPSLKRARVQHEE